MKNNCLTILIAASLMFMSTASCKKTLEPEIYSQLTNDNFPKTEKDINSILTSFYSQFTHDWGPANPTTGVNMWGVFSSMNSWSHISSATTDEKLDSWSPQFKFQWGSAFDTYDYLYSKISFVARATAFLKTLEDAGISEGLKKSAIAETKCLRAWLMFLLYDFYGPVSVKLDPAKLSDNSFEARPSKQTYLDAIVNDLTTAIPDLSDRTNDTQLWGKVNKGLARMLLMKLYMNDHQWPNAKAVATELLGMGYSLQSSYKNVFIQEGNNEVVWAVPSGINVPNHWLPTNLPWDAKKIAGIDVDPGWSGYYMPWSFYNTFPAGDTRLQTIAAEYDDMYGNHYKHGSGNEGYDLPKGALVIKYLVPYELNKTGNFSTVAFRYADVLLSMAEIQNEINNGISQADIDSYVKPVTDRAGISIPAGATTSKEAFKIFLLAERGRELFWEGWRRQDLIRFGKFIEYGQTAGHPAANHMVLFPIPPRVVQEAGGIVANNPGY